VKKTRLLPPVTAFLLVWLPAALGAQAGGDSTRPPRPVPRLTGPVTLDGPSEEEAWKSVPPLPLVQVLPDNGRPPSERTEILIAHDDHFLYIAGRCWTSDPRLIQAPSKKRDYFEGNTDMLCVIIDTFNDKENALAFFTTPTGLRWDGSITNDAEPRSINDNPMNTSWNAFWDAAAVRTGPGWFAEMRIPFSSLRFQDTNGRVVMGLLAWRWIAAKVEVDCFPTIDPNIGSQGIWKPSRGREVILEGVHGRNPLYVTPYLLGGYGQSNELNDEGTAYVHRDRPTAEAGLDVKYGLTSNLTLDLSLNTDFAQVEADDFQVNLTRFSLFFPEKRLFFLERAGIFDFSFGEYNQLFYSRSIGISDEEQVRIYGGARLIGRLGGWDLGLLDMQTAPLHGQGLPTENFSVFRTRRRVFNPYSYIGGMVTARLGGDGSYNLVYGLDASIRVGGDDYLLLNWAQSLENGKANDLASLDPSRFRLTWNRRNLRGLGFNLGYSYSGRDYSPGMGFEMRENFGRFGNRFSYGWLPGVKSSLTNHYVFADGYLYLRNDDGSVESAEVGPGWGFFAKSGWNGEFAVKACRESVGEELSFFDRISVPPGEYSFWTLRGYLMNSPGGLFQVLGTIDAGAFYDGWKATVGLRPLWGVSSVVSLSGYYELDRVEFPNRHQSLTAHIGQVRVTANLGTSVSTLALLQYDSAEGQVTVNLRLRYNPREGNDLYLVVNETLNSRRVGYFPPRPSFGGRAILVKYSHTFVSN
jgi:hypothetical protein